MDEMADSVEQPDTEGTSTLPGFDALLAPDVPHPRVMALTIPFTAREMAHIEVAAANAGVSVEQLAYDRVMAPTRR